MIFDEIVVDGPAIGSNYSDSPSSIIYTTENILDAASSIIGTIALPEETSEDTWKYSLNLYLYNNELTWNEIRRQRDVLLNNTIWMMQRHQSQESLETTTTLTSDEYASWLIYWQTLRDIPQTYDSPSSVIWPEKP